MGRRRVSAEGVLAGRSRVPIRRSALVDGLSADADNNEAKSGVWRLSAVAELIWNAR